MVYCQVLHETNPVSLGRWLCCLGGERTSGEEQELLDFEIRMK